jgi:hypothetical protein
MSEQHPLQSAEAGQRHPGQGKECRNSSADVGAGFDERIRTSSLQPNQEPGLERVASRCCCMLAVPTRSLRSANGTKNPFLLSRAGWDMFIAVGDYEYLNRREAS